MASEEKEKEKSSLPDDASDAPRCSQCSATSVELLRCAGCGGPQYCGVACQKAAWPTHRVACAAARAQDAAPTDKLARRLRKLKLKAQAQDRVTLSSDEVRKTGKLLRSALRACSDDAELATLAAETLRAVLQKYMIDGYADEHGLSVSASDKRSFMKLVMTDLVNCGLLHVKSPIVKPVITCLACFTCPSFLPGEPGSRNEARRAGVLRFVYDAMLHHRDVASGAVRIQSDAFLFLFAFLHDFKPEGTVPNTENGHQAKRAGLADPLEYAARNDLIEHKKARDDCLRMATRLRNHLEPGTQVKIPRSIIEEAIKSGQGIVQMPECPEIVYKRMGVPYVPPGPNRGLGIRPDLVRRYAQQTRDPDALKYLADLEDCNKQLADMRAYDADEGPYVDEDGIPYSASLPGGDSAPDGPAKPYTVDDVWNIPFGGSVSGGPGAATAPPATLPADLASIGVKALKALCRDRGIDASAFVEKKELVAALEATR